MQGIGSSTRMIMPCEIVDFFDKDNPHGKVPKSMANDLIIME